MKDTCTAGLVGLGAFGAFVRNRLQERGVKVYCHDIDPTKSSSGLAEAAMCNIVVLCVPRPAFESTLLQVLPHMRQDTILIDVCTVKRYPSDILAKHAADRRYINVHPLFGEQSWLDNGSSLRGLELVVTGKSGNVPAEVYEHMQTLIRHVGIKIVNMTAEEHDVSVVAHEQLLVQFLGQVIARAGFALNSRNVHTRSARHFFAAMEMVRHDAPLFKDASRCTPEWQEVARRLETAWHEVREEVNGYDAEAQAKIPASAGE